MSSQNATGSASESTKKESIPSSASWNSKKLQRLERSRYEAERAQRQYEAVEPENRLVARELERQWEKALQELQALEQQYARFRRAHPATLSDEERELVRSLSENLPAVWKASTTNAVDRQRIVRLLVDRVVVTMRSWVHVVRQLPGYSGKLICWADADELDRLQQLRQAKCGWWAPPPDELITPKVPTTD